MASIKKEIQVEAGRSPRKQETSISQDLLNQPTVYLHLALHETCPLGQERREHLTGNSKLDALFLDGARRVSGLKGHFHRRSRGEHLQPQDKSDT